MGIVFDGDGDRIAAIDEQGRYCSTQLLMPLLIDHLARARNLPGKVIKTRNNFIANRMNALIYHRNALAYARGEHRAWDGPDAAEALRREQEEVTAEFQRLYGGDDAIS